MHISQDAKLHALHKDSKRNQCVDVPQPIVCEEGRPVKVQYEGHLNQAGEGVSQEWLPGGGNAELWRMCRC